MMKWITLALSLLFGSKQTKGPNFKEMAMEVIEEAIYRGRKPVALVLLGLMSIVFTCGGILIALIDVTRQWDNSGAIVFGAVFWSGVLLAAVCLCGYAYVFTHKWPGVHTHKLKAAVRAQHDKDARNPPGLDEALSLLIMDHIDERKTRRMQKQSRDKNPPPPGPTASRDEDSAHHPPTGFA